MRRLLGAGGGKMARRALSPATSFPCTSVRDQAEFWRKVDGCSEDARVTYDHGKARCVE